MNYDKLDVLIGVDNGISGAMVAISAHHGLVIDKALMPIEKMDGVNRIDPARLSKWISDRYDTDFAVAIEACPEHARQKSIMRSMAMSFGVIYGAIRAKFPDIAIAEIRSGNSRDSWQRSMLGKVPQGKTKEFARAKAREIWPDEDWLATPRSKKAHEGFIDAALIAEFYRRKLL
jgi:hypothetical protein